MTTTVTAPRTGRSLISVELFSRLVTRVHEENNLDNEHAERIVDQALAFLGACAVNPGVPLSPSPEVDTGWHAFIVHTREYAAFCDRIAGRFIHHVPTGHGKCNPDRCSATGKDGNENQETIIDQVVDVPAALSAAGYAVDKELWSQN